MASTGKSSHSATGRKPTKKALPAADVRDFREQLQKFVNTKDDQGRKWASSKWGVYAFYDYDGEPIYVGQTKEKLSGRIGRHLTNQRSDAVAMRVLDPMEVAEVEIWPLWNLQEATTEQGQTVLDASEYSAYLKAIDESRFKAILNEKIPPVSEPIELPPSLRMSLITEALRQERGHADIRIGRRAETLSRLSAVVRERGEVTEGLRRVIVIQAVRLAFLAAERLSYAEGRIPPDPAAIDVWQLVGSVLAETSEDEPKDEPDQ